jgi:hypothetical protein
MVAMADEGRVESGERPAPSETAPSETAPSETAPSETGLSAPAQGVGAEERPFSDELEEWLRSDGPKTIGALGEVFAEKGLAVAILLLMLVPAIPAPTGGVTHVFEVITVLLASRMVAGYTTIWLPRRFRNRELGSVLTGKALPFIVRRVRSLERFSRPRFATLFNRKPVLRLLGLLIIGFTVGAALAPPFSGLDTLPALGVVLIALAIILEDAAFLIAGAVIGTAGVVLEITIGAALARWLRNLF